MSGATTPRRRYLAALPAPVSPESAAFVAALALAMRLAARVGWCVLVVPEVRP